MWTSIRVAICHQSSLFITQRQLQLARELLLRDWRNKAAAVPYIRYSTWRERYSNTTVSVNNTRMKKNAACNNDFTGSGFTLYARANDKRLFFRGPLVSRLCCTLSILAATTHACVSRSIESYCSVSVCYCPISMSIIRMNESKTKKKYFSISHGHCKRWISCSRQLLESCCWYLFEISVRSDGSHFSRMLVIWWQRLLNQSVLPHIVLKAWQFMAHGIVLTIIFIWIYYINGNLF